MQLRMQTALWYRPQGRRTACSPPPTRRGLPVSQTILPPAAIECPSGDVKPMAENDAQLAAEHEALLRKEGR